MPSACHSETFARRGSRAGQAAPVSASFLGILKPVILFRDGSIGRRATTRALGTDRVSDIAMVLGLFVTYLLLDRLTQALVSIERADLGRASLLGASIANRWWLYLAVLALAAVATVFRRDRMLAPWDRVEHGSTLRLLALPLIAYLAWKGALYPYNFIADEAHLIDRLLVGFLGVAALYRPMFLIPLVVQSRVISEQTLFPFGTAASKNVDEFLTVSLLAVVAGYVLYLATGYRKTGSVVLLLGAVVSSHFYVPGKAKLAIGWLTETDIANLPLGSYTAGWLGHTGGSWARVMSGFLDTFSVAVMVGTLVLEVGAVVAVVHSRLLRWWLPGWLVFHAFTFAFTGFLFIGWAALEVGLLVVLVQPRFRSWVRENATPARGAIAVVAVLGGPVLFHPPGLAWLDAPVSYGYEVEAIGESGRQYHVPLSAFAPLDHEMTFSRLQLGSTVPLSGGYGSLSNAKEMQRLVPLTTFEEVAGLEAQQPPTTLVEESEVFVLAFFDRANTGPAIAWLYGFGPPAQFWSSRETPRYDFDEPLTSLEVYQVTALHRDGSPLFRRELVLEIERGADGAGEVKESSTAS